MYKKAKLLLAAIAMTIFILLPPVFTYAAEVSEETLNVLQDGKEHTVIAFGKSIAMVYSDENIEIIANNPSGRIDVMLDGKVNKGIGAVMIPAKSSTNIVLEEGSFLINSVNEKQAISLKGQVHTGITADTPIDSISLIENLSETEGINTFVVGKHGELQTSDGTNADIDMLPKIQIKTPEVVYETFAQQLQESIRQEQEERQKEQEKNDNRKSDEKSKKDTSKNEEETDSSNNDISSECQHEFIDSAYMGPLVMHTYDRCATGPFKECIKCGMLCWTDEGNHIHGEEYCEYCGFNKYGEREGQDNNSDEIISICQHEWVSSKFAGELILNGYEACTTGPYKECIKCGTLSWSINHFHGEEYCEYCGFNKYGERENYID